MAFTLPISMHKFRQMSDKTPLCIPWAATPLDARRARTRRVQKSRGRPLLLFQTLVWGRRLRPYGCTGLKSGALLVLIRTFPQSVETYPLSPLRKCLPGLLHIITLFWPTIWLCAARAILRPSVRVIAGLNCRRSARSVPHRRTPSPGASRTPPPYNPENGL